MQPIKTIFLSALIIGSFESNYAQSNENSMDDYERRLEYIHKLGGHKRVDVEGFILYMDTDSIPQDVFLLPYPLKSFDNEFTLEENFEMAISQFKGIVSEEFFDPMRWTMPTLLEELKKCSYFKVESDFPQFLNGGNLRVVYGRITYTKKQSPIIPPPTTSELKIKFHGKEYQLMVDGPLKNYGYSKLFRSLR